jgi:hypothetical protein
MEALFTILLFIGIMVIAGLLFGGWVIVMIVRFLIRAVSGGNSRSRIAQHPIAMIRCSRRGCGAQNPANARFCRRCGREAPASDDYEEVRHAANW